jgi:hypothetical protein
MTARTAAAVSSVALALATVGCLSVYEVQIETPIQAKIDVSSFQRVLVVGFVSGGSKVVDTNAETVRLLKSQLRTKSDLKVVDADPMALADEIDKRRKAAGETPLVTPATATPADAQLLPIKDQKDLKAYADQLTTEDWKAIWRGLGEKYQSPLIVTGSILFTETASSGMQSSVRTTQDATGKPIYTEDRTYVDKKGFAIDPTFVFIDSRTGNQLYSETYHQDVSYTSSQNTPPLSSYFELMDKVVPSFLNTLSNQKIKGTRILLK